VRDRPHPRILADNKKKQKTSKVVNECTFNGEEKWGR
jgi:hypothetical protein